MKRRSIKRNASGASSAEYALILGILGAAIAVAAFTLGGDISAAINATAADICSGTC